MKQLRKLFRKLVPSVRFSRTPAEKKVFCISMQRTGTTSVGLFLSDFGYKWAGWPAARRNDWTRHWYEGNYETIFNSTEFRAANAYEDSPWFYPNFYKILYHRFPGAKFILFTRDPDAWFRSMQRHSDGNILGTSRIHSKIYRREMEFFNLLTAGKINEEMENGDRYNKTMKIIPDLSEHYKAIYTLHTMEARDFFNRHAPDALHIGTLEDPEKWQKLGRFFGISVPDNYEIHENRSK